MSYPKRGDVYWANLDPTTANLPYPSKIKVFQLRCIDKGRLNHPSIGSVSAEHIAMLNEKIQIVTGLY